ncbi:MAG: YdcH family protein [Sphingomonadaceae bacterium]
MSDKAFRLLERHQKLDARLRALQALRWPDPFELARLRKLKLAIRDRLAQLAIRPARRQT